ncbi:MAG: hypothetical protein P8Q35_05495 [Candidatus Thalassarchaeaceae archaeon]|nr:hypothetical protein [Candidatus Thalassarchaeaceae archaeon]
MSPAYRANQISSITMALLMLTVSAMGYFVFQEEATVREELAAEEEARFVTSPGHPVFSQYITSDNCGYCYAYGSPAHHSIKSQHPDDYVYISYQSVSYGDTDTTRAGNTPGYNWAWSTGGAPDSYWGDRLDKRVSGCGSNTCYDTMFASGGGMSAATTSQYLLTASVSESGSNLDVNIDVEYLGSGTAPSNIYLYAAMTEETCNSYTYNDGSRGHNCWKSWLMSDGEYRTQSGGSGSGFQIVSLSSNIASYSWSVPSGQVSGGSGNALVVAALMTGAPSTGDSSEHVLTATDSNMGPMIDVGITDFKVTNTDGIQGFGNQGFVSGDTLELEVNLRNNGVDAYQDGGTIKIYHLSGGNEIELTSVSVNQLGVGGTQSYSVTFDSSEINMLPSGTSSFRARLSDLVGDKVPGNNNADALALHDMPPVPNRPNSVGSPMIERGSSIQFESTAMSNDLVDDMMSMTAELQYSPAGSEAWDNSWISSAIRVDSSTGSHYVHTIDAPLTASAGSYDIRMKWTDSGGQSSEWQVTNNAFTLQNALPLVLTSSDEGFSGIPTVKVGMDELVSIDGQIFDMETPLSMLTIESDDSRFISFDPASLMLSVNFDSIVSDSHGNSISQGIYFTVMDDDGGINSGTVMFNIIENGQPRWAAIPTQSFNEGGSDSIILSPYLSDTNDHGESSSVNQLSLSLIENTNSELINAEINGFTLNVEAVDDNNFGVAKIIVRATDTSGKESDTEITYHVNNVNDPPSISVNDYESMTMQITNSLELNIIEIVTDVDDSDDEIWITVENEVPGAVHYNPISGILSMSWNLAGEQVVEITAEDRHGDSSTETISVTVVNNLPLSWADVMGIGDLLLEINSVEYGSNPTVQISNVGQHQLTDNEAHWSVCNTITGICNDFGISYNLGTFVVLANSGEGLKHGDYIGIFVIAVDSDGFKRASEEYQIMATDSVVTVDPTDPIDPDEPKDTGKNEALDIWTVGLIAFVLLFVVIVSLGITIVYRRQNNDLVYLENRNQQNVVIEENSRTQIPPPPIGMSPPLPPEGLPPGWTMEQWDYYGSEYLRRRFEP